MENIIYSEKLLKPREVADMLNISRSLVYQLIRSQEIPAVRIKSTVRVKASDLAEFMNGNQKKNEKQLPLF